MKILKVFICSYLKSLSTALFILWTVIVHSESKDDITLRLVHVLYRHGDRSAITPYKNDPYNESDWPQGFGQLTQTGMEQEYRLGQFLRQRYIESELFMDSKYERSQIYVRSTDMDRTLMSAYCVLTGLYPPNNTQVWDRNVTWQPIPVHTVPRKDDFLLMLENCPNMYKPPDTEQEKVDNKRKKDFLQKNKGMIDHVAKSTGVSADLDGFFTTLDPVFCEHKNGKKMPSWVNSEYLNNLVSYRDFSASLSITNHHAIRLKGGSMVGTFLKQMQTKALNVSSGHKMYMYSAHDSNVIALLRALGVYDNKQPPYTACVMIELHEIQPHKFEVRVFHKNVTKSDENVVLRNPIVPGCPSNSCPLDIFAKALAQRDVIPSDVKRECGVNTQNLKITDYLPVAVLSLLCVILLFVLIGVCVHYRRLHKKLMYKPLPTDEL